MSVGAVAMSASTIIVAANAQLLRRVNYGREPLIGQSEPRARSIPTEAGSLVEPSRGLRTEFESGFTVRSGTIELLQQELQVTVAVYPEPRCNECCQVGRTAASERSHFLLLYSFGYEPAAVKPQRRQCAAPGQQLLRWRWAAHRSICQ